MKKEIIIASTLGLVAGLVIMHFAMKKKESKSGADGDFIIDRSKKVWDNMVDDVAGPANNNEKMNMLDFDANNVSNMLDVSGRTTKFGRHDPGVDGTPIDPKGGKLYYPKGASNMLGADGRQWPNEKTGIGWS